MKKILQHITLILLMLIGIQAFAQDNNKNTVSFGGHVFTEFFPIEIGKVFLHPEGNPSTIIDTATVDTLGYYYFYRKPAGNYYISALLDKNDPNYFEFAYTFYPNSTYQDSAQLIEISADNWELDIRLAKTFKNSTGPGFIGGQIQKDGSDIKIEGIELMIIDDNSNIITHNQTNELGNFKLSDLSNGSYTLYPQILGYQTIPYHFEITDSNINHENVIMTIKNGQISSYINEAIVADLSFKCFPNPANHTLNLSFEFDGAHTIQTRVLDITGRTILEIQDFSSSQYFEQISTSNWDNGYYFVEVFINGTKAISQKVAVLH